MSDLVEALIDAGDWSGVDVQALSEDAARVALVEAGVDPARCEISLLFTDDAAIAELNARFRGKDKPTNVLSWPAFDLAPEADGAAPPPPPLAPDGRTPIGDIALAAGTVAQEARERNLALPHHVAHLIVHGVLHLLGYDHETSAGAEAMESVERAALAKLGIADPYG